MLGYWGYCGVWLVVDDDSFIVIDGQCFFCIGDFCLVDDEGYFFMCDWFKCMINVLGFKVWLVEVENLLYVYLVIYEVCVIVMFDVCLGEVVKVVVVFKFGQCGQVSEVDLIVWVCIQMVVYKVLWQVCIVDELFKLGIGKILWCVLQDVEIFFGEFCL